MRVTDSIKPSNSAKCFVVGVAGGSGSGKTYFAKALREQLNKNFHPTAVCEILYQDSYYIDQSARFDHDGGAVNFDHPSSIDFALLAQHLRDLKQGISISVPIYDFVTHSRKSETVPTSPRPIVLVDGILLFHVPEVRALFDDLVFFDTPENLRFQRRLERDVVERGRSEEGIRQQFQRQVKPMHDQFVEPSKAFANTLIKDIGEFETSLQLYHEKLTQEVRRTFLHCPA
jgi:uridine kinase